MCLSSASLPYLNVASTKELFCSLLYSKHKQMLNTFWVDQGGNSGRLWKQALLDARMERSSFHVLSNFWKAMCFCFSPPLTLCYMQLVILGKGNPIDVGGSGREAPGTQNEGDITLDSCTWKVSPESGHLFTVWCPESLASPGPSMRSPRNPNSVI